MTNFRSSLKTSVNSPSLNAAPFTDQMAKSTASDIYNRLREQGFNPRDIISVSSQLIELVTEQISSPK